MRPALITFFDESDTPWHYGNNPSNVGVQEIYTFENGYGASLIKTDSSYGARQGLWELAVIQFANRIDIDPANRESWKLVYDTPVTSDVIGYLNRAEWVEILNQIRKLGGGEDNDN